MRTDHPTEAQMQARTAWMPSARSLMVTALGLMVARLILATRTELLPEEAYYWNYLQHPALGYFDHPPMVSWVIGFGTALLGDTELGVRLGTILLSAGSCLLMFSTARLWFGERVARWTTLLFLILPVYLALGFLAFPDGPLLFFWLLALYAVSKAVQAGPTRMSVGPGQDGATGLVYWLLAGGAFGAALLSKYTAVMLAPSLLLFLALSPVHRFWLRRAQPWLALALGLLVFSPVVVWNAQHDWASFWFQTTRTAAPDPTRLWRTLLVFWSIQVVITTPFVFALLAMAVRCSIQRGWRSGEAGWNFAASFGAPLFLVFVYASFKTAVRINWTAPAFLSMLPAAGAILTNRLSTASPARVRAWWIAGALTVGLGVIPLALGHVNLAWGWPAGFAYTNVGGWRELAEVVEAAESELAARTGRHPFVIGADKYNLAAELSFYSGDPEEHINTLAIDEHGLGFRYWVNLGELEGRDAVVVLREEHRDALLTRLHDYFSHVGSPRPVRIPSQGRRPRTFYLVFCQEYHPAGRE